MHSALTTNAEGATYPRSSLIPKWPLSPRGTKWISGRYLQAEYFIKLFETFSKDRKIG